MSNYKTNGTGNSIYSDITDPEKVAYSLKLALSRVTTDAFRPGKEWYTEPELFLATNKKNILSKPIEKYIDIKDYYIVVTDPISNNKYITKITAETIVFTHAGYKLSDIRTGGSGSYAVLEVQASGDNKDYSRTPISEDFENETGLLKKLPITSWCFYYYWLNKLTGKGAMSETAERGTGTGTYPNVHDKFSAQLTLGSDGNPSGDFVYSNVIGNDILMNSLRNYQPLELINPSDINLPIDQVNGISDDLKLKILKHIKINLQVPTVSTAYDVNANAETGDNIAFYNPLIERSLAETEGYNAKGSGNGYWVMGTDNDYTNITPAFGTPNVTEGTMFFSSMSGFLLFFGVKEIINGSIVSAKNPPMVTAFKYTGETFSDGIISQGDTLPAVEVSNDKDLFINTTDNTIHRLQDSNGTKEWVGIGGSDVWEESSSNSNIFYNSSGNVGIGTDSPALSLDVHGNYIGRWLGSNHTNAPNTHYKDSSSVRDSYYMGRWDGPIAQSETKAFSGMELKVDTALNMGTGNSDNQSAIMFHTWGNGISNSREVMRIDANGKVGIGTTSPANKLDVRGDMRVYNQFHSGHYSGAEYYQSIIYLGGDSYSPQIRVKRRDGNSEKTDLEFWVSGENVAARHVMSIQGGSKNVAARITGGLYVDGVVTDYNNIWSRHAYIQDKDGHHTQHFGASDEWRVGMKVTYSIWCLGVIGVSSDERIKENISEIDDSYSLQKVRDISCVWYNYKDKLSRGNGKVVGFIAQQVKEHLPEAVSIQNGVIPNEMRNLEDISWNGTDMCCDLSDVSGVKYRFYVSNDLSGNDEEMKEIVGNEDNTFTFDASYNNVFCYGREVDDFNILDKQKLFALNFSATQEIDRIQQQQLIDISGNKVEIELLKLKNETLKTENNELANKINNLENQNANLLSRLEAIEKRLQDANI